MIYNPIPYSGLIAMTAINYLEHSHKTSYEKEDLIQEGFSIFDNIAKLYIKKYEKIDAPCCFNTFLIIRLNFHFRKICKKENLEIINSHSKLVAFTGVIEPEMESDIREIEPRSFLLTRLSKSTINFIQLLFIADSSFLHWMINQPNRTSFQLLVCKYFKINKKEYALMKEELKENLIY